MFSYTISKNANKKEFENACLKLEKAIKIIKKVELIEDVDGSMVQIYEVNDSRIKVVDDYEVDAVYIDSEIDLKDIFSVE